MFNYIYWNYPKEAFYLPFIKYPLVWYSIFFFAGFFIGYYIFISVLSRYFSITKTDLSKLEIKKLSAFIGDKLTIYMVAATVIGARLGHLIFYENPGYYLKNPFVIFKTWEGGLASHGAAIMIFVFIWFFQKKINKMKIDISYIHILDFICLPVAFAGACIRVGNFFNQEILGLPTNLPWAVIFANPADGSAIVPRHPVQLYEAMAYLIVFIVLTMAVRKKTFLVKEGRLLGMFLLLVFAVRFVLEFLKIEQSYFFNESLLSMGQYLSIPFIVLGMILLFWNKVKTFYLKNNKIMD